MDKRALLDAVIAALAAELETLTAAAKDARAYATDEQSRSEDKHDTRAIEASYLADGQGRAALEAQEALTAFRTLDVRTFSEGEPIAVGAVVGLEVGRQREFYFVGPRGGGLEVQFDGRDVFVITPQSPIGRKLLGRKVGDAVAFEGPRAGRPARIATVV